MKQIIALFILLITLGTAQARDNQFEQFGDAMRFLPLYVMIVSVAMEDYEGAGQLALGTLTTQVATEGIKRSLEALHEKGGYELAFAKRPCCDDWKGMPSGHTSGAFSAAGFVYYRYGWKPAIPVTLLATLTAASRVEAKKHSLLQVSVGAALAWGFAWVFTNEYMPKDVLITPSVESDEKGSSVGVNVSYRF